MTEEQKVCDVVVSETLPAVCGYTTPWGTQGYASEKGVFLLKQQMANLGRKDTDLVLIPLQKNDQNDPVSRSERTQLIAARMSAEQDADDSKVRASKLYDQNLELTKELGNARTLAAEAQAQVNDLKATLATTNDELATQTKKASRLADEVVRLEGVVAEGPSQQAAEELKSLREQLEKANAQIEELTNDNQD